MLDREKFKELIGSFYPADQHDLDAEYEHVVSTLNTLYDSYEKLSTPESTKGKEENDVKYTAVHWNKRS